MTRSDGDLQRRILRELTSFHVGPERAVRQAQLAGIVHCKPRDVARAINALRRQGEPIASTCTSDARGYYLAQNLDELAHTLAQLRHRISEQHMTLDGLSAAFRPKVGTLFWEE